MDPAAADAQRDALATAARVPRHTYPVRTRPAGRRRCRSRGRCGRRSADDAAPGDGGLSNAGDGVGGDDVVGDAGLDDDSDTEDAVEDLDDQDDLADRAPVGDSFGEGPEYAPVPEPVEGRSRLRHSRTLSPSKGERHSRSRSDPGTVLTPVPELSKGAPASTPGR